jgi:spore coat protein U-like protein
MKTPSLLRLVGVAALSPVLFLSSGAGAAEDTTEMDVTITITSACSITTTADMNFGIDVASTATNVDATGTLSVTCTLLTPYDIGIDTGLHPDAGVRRMADTTDGSQFVPYALYRDLARTQAWGTTIGTDTLGGVGTGLPLPTLVYGRVPSANFPALSYADTVTATLTY